MSDDYELRLERLGRLVTKVGDRTVGEDTNLRRELLIANDPGSKVRLDSSIDLVGDKDPRLFEAYHEVVTHVHAEAVCFGVLCFDIFGAQLHAASHTEITPFYTEFRRDVRWTWAMPAMAAAITHRIVTYIKKARLGDGKIWIADERKLASRLAQHDLHFTIDEPA